MASMVQAGMRLMQAKAAVTVTAGTDVPYGALTPETLIAYCASKMRGIDTQIQQCFAKQQARNAKSQVLSDLQSKLSNYKIGFQNNPEARKDIEMALAKAKAAFVDDPALSEQLDKVSTSFNATMNDDWASEGEVTGWMNSVQSIQQGINQDGELEMLQMQSMMSQRQQSVQLCTNMIQGLGQTSQAVAANIGK